MGMRNSEIRK